jgi:hypothetical protein
VDHHVKKLPKMLVPPKRNYVRRKKYLKQSASLLKSTLWFINSTLPTPRSAAEMDWLAEHHAAAIDALCWAPRASRLTDTRYQELVVSKTRELCMALVCQIAPEARAGQAMEELRGLGVLPCAVAPPAVALPVPILRRREFPAIEQIIGGELPGMRIPGADLFFDRDRGRR